jgi:hypothetical protein
VEESTPQHGYKAEEDPLEEDTQTVDEEVVTGEEKPETVKGEWQGETKGPEQKVEESTPQQEYKPTRHITKYQHCMDVHMTSLGC